MARTEYTIDSDIIRDVQKELNARGYDAGTPDGELGSKTRSALRRFQAENGLPESGRVDRETAEKLGIRW